VPKISSYGEANSLPDTKLVGIETGDPDAVTVSVSRLLDRANHTGYVSAGDVSGLAIVAKTGLYSDLSGAPSLGSLAAKNTVASGDIDNGAVTLAKMANMATASLLGRSTAGTGVPEVLSAATVRTLLNVANGATANSPDATLLARANHTGTQTASTISDFSTAADARIAAAVGVSVQAYDAAALKGALGATDNRLLRSDGTGGVTAQGSPITVADDGAVSGVNTLTATGAMTLDRVGNAVFTVRGTAAPIWWFEATDSATDKKIFQVVNYAGDFFLRSRTDANTAVAEMFRCAHAGGMIIGSPTGGNKGLGTLNATAVYDDNTLLTCMALQREFREKGAIDLAKWDAMVPALVIPEQREQVPVLWPVQVSRVVAVTEPDQDGRLVRRAERIERTIEVEAVIADPVYDEAGEIIDAVETPLFDEVVTPERVIVREHRTARLFKALIEDGFDPRDPEQYFARMKADEALPGMPTKRDWEHNSLSAGEMMGRLWLAAEMQAIVANVMWGKLKDHETRISAMEAT